MTGVQTCALPIYATKTPEMKAKLDAQFVIAKSDTPAEFDKIVRDEIANLTQVFKEAGL